MQTVNVFVSVTLSDRDTNELAENGHIVVDNKARGDWRLNSEELTTVVANMARAAINSFRYMPNSATSTPAEVVKVSSRRRTVTIHLNGLDVEIGSSYPTCPSCGDAVDVPPQVELIGQVRCICGYRADLEREVRASTGRPWGGRPPQGIISRHKPDDPFDSCWDCGGALNVDPAFGAAGQLALCDCDRRSERVNDAATATGMYDRYDG